MTAGNAKHLELTEKELEQLTVFVQKALTPAKIVKVIQRAERDPYADDDYVNLLVVFEAENDLLDPHKLLSLFSAAKDMFHKLNVDSDALPIFSFSTEKELKGLGY